MLVPFPISIFGAGIACLFKVAKFTGANDQGKLSWVSWAYKPIYKIRSFVKEKVKRKSLVAYNAIKFGSIASFLFLLYLIF